MGVELIQLRLDCLPFFLAFDRDHFAGGCIVLADAIFPGSNIIRDFDEVATP